MRNFDFHSPSDAGSAVTSYVDWLIRSAQRFEDAPVPCGVVVSPDQHKMLLWYEENGNDDRSNPPIWRCDNGFMLVYQMYVLVKEGVAMPYLIFSRA